MNMYSWIDKMMYGGEKKAMPILSFPAVQFLYITVKELVSSSDYMALGMRLIADKYDMPAALGFMDLSVEAEAFGAHAVYAADEVPCIIGKLVTDMEDVENLRVPEVGEGRTSINLEAIKKAQKLIHDRPIFSQCTGPYSLAGRLINVNDIMLECYEEPETVHALLRKATDFIKAYVLAQKEMGANGVIMAEPLAGILSPELMEEFSTPYVREIVDAVQDESFIVIYHNCGNSVTKLVKGIVDTGCLVFHFGDSIDLREMIGLMPRNVLIMGNVSPSRVFNNRNERIVDIETRRVLQECSQFNNFMISSGCDLPPYTDLDNIDMFFDTVKSYYYIESLKDMLS